MSGIKIAPFFRVLELWQAAYSGDVIKLQELLEDPTVREKINYKLNSQGNHTALFFACYGAANAETIRLLLLAGADPYLRDNAGRLPLHLAANTQDSELIAALLEAPNMRNFRYTPANNGQTSLHALFIPGFGISSAVKAKNADLSKCLPLFLDEGNDPFGALQNKDNNGISSLMLVKHYQLKDVFMPFVPPAKRRLFEIYLRTLSIPGNIDELLKSHPTTTSLETTLGTNENIKINENIVYIEENEEAAERRSFKL
jgi:hypothetical protein